jgi:hypothetical protein
LYQRAVAADKRRPGRLACLRGVWYDAVFSPRGIRFRSAPSPRGKAEVCKTSIPGSNPGGASILKL